MYKLDIFTLKDRVEMDLGLSVFGDMFRLFTPNDPPRGIRLFKDIIKIAMDKFSDVYPVELSTTLTGQSYTFKDNFDDFVAGKITEDEIELVPLCIAAVGQRFNSGYYWDYNKRTGKLSTLNGGVLSGRIYYWAANPMKLEIGPDNNFTEDSYIYLTYPQDEARFLVWLELEIAHKLMNIVRSINMNNQIDILPNIDNIIANLEQKKASLTRTSAAPLLAWRK